MALRRIAYGASVLATIAATVIACTRLDLSSLGAASPGWIGVGLALNSSALLLRACAWLGTLRGALPGVAVSAGGVVRATMIGVLVSAVAPARAGEPLRTWLVSRRLEVRDALATVAGTVLAQSMLNVVALLTLALVALPAVVAGRGPSGALAAVALPFALVALILIGVRVAGRGRFGRSLQALRSGLAIFRQRRRGAVIAALQLSAWALQTLAACALLFALHVDVAAPLATAAAILFAVNVTAAVPLTPSNIGVFQAACIGVLSAAGVAAGAGLAYGILLQATEIVTAVALGLPAAAFELASAGRSSAPPRPAAAAPQLDDDHHGEREQHSSRVDVHRRGI